MAISPLDLVVKVFVFLQFIHLFFPLLTDSSHPFAAYHVEEDSAVFGRHPPESVWLPADALCGQAARYTLQGSGSHGGHTGVPQSGDAAG